MKNVLIIGGTRNIGHQMAWHLIESGSRLTILNRGIDPDDLPDSVYRLRADRTDVQQMRRALMTRSFDVVIDFVMYKGREASQLIDLLQDRIGQYIFMSTGQVYLVREDIERPFREEDYVGRLMPPPTENTYAYEEWRYGMDKREAEDIFTAAYKEKNFPYSVLRLPMVNSERDPFKRLYSYMLRLKDGGPVLIPEKPTFPLRHVYVQDVVQAVEKLMEKGIIGRAFNISQDETVSIDTFLGILAEHMGTVAQTVRVKRAELEANGFLPDCSPFSDRWMSEITNERSKTELGMTYTPLTEYLGRLVDYYRHTRPSVPVGYKRRQAEIQLAATLQT